MNKQRRDDSESFDSRSQYIVMCAGQQQTWASAAPQYYPSGGSPYAGQYQQPFPASMPPAYGPTQPYQQMMPGNGYAPQYSGIPVVRFFAQTRR